MGAASDFELEEADSGSEVFAIDEDDVDQNAATAMTPGLLEDDDEGFDDSTPSGEMSSSAWDVEGEGASAPDRSASSPILAPSAATAEWGGLWVGLLGVTTVLMLLLTFISMDLIRNLYDLPGRDARLGARPEHRRDHGGLTPGRPPRAGRSPSSRVRGHPPGLETSSCVAPREDVSRPGLFSR